LRILHLLASPVFSGPMENVALLAQAQRALGHDVSLAIDRKRSGLASEEPACPRLQRLGILDDGGLELSVKSSPWRMLQDARCLRRRSVDVVHAHFTHDHVLARWSGFRGVLVRSIHSPRSLRWSLPRAHAYTVSTPQEAAQLRNAVVLPALTAPEFVPTDDQRALRESLGLTGDLIVGMVSTFQISRRHDAGVLAFAQLASERPGARFVLVGDGETLPATRAAITALGLSDRVTFAGYQSGEDFVRWVQALDVLWVLGLGNDYSGRIAAQARACGVRVVAVPQGALPSLADELVSTLSPNAIVAATLSGERRALKRLSNEEIARAVIALYA
jgi:glycosyltransferase involved in cell wall biosynthesis